MAKNPTTSNAINRQWVAAAIVQFVDLLLAHVEFRADEARRQQARLAEFGIDVTIRQAPPEEAAHGSR